MSSNASANDRWKVHSTFENQYAPVGIHPAHFPPIRHISDPYQSYAQTPRLVRASSLNVPNPEALLNVKVTVDFQGEIGTMVDNWTEDEIRCSRRLVQVSAVQQYNHLTLFFKPITQEEYVLGSPVVSCIYWEKTGRYYLTSVDLILLLEHLVQAKFPVEEKNRIRRNLQSIKPLTIAKTNPKYSEFFSLIMNYNNPRPRHIEKGVKVLYWDHLKEALAKVLSKYTVDPFVDGHNNISNESSVHRSTYDNQSAEYSTPPLQPISRPGSSNEASYILETPAHIPTFHVVNPLPQPPFSSQQQYVSPLSYTASIGPNDHSLPSYSPDSNYQYPGNSYPYSSPYSNKLPPPPQFPTHSTYSGSFDPSSGPTYQALPIQQVEAYSSGPEGYESGAPNIRYVYQQ